MSRAGFVLVGGASSRMGRDKALLPFGGGTLAGHVAAQVAAAAGSVILIGDPTRYARLGYPVIADATPGSGPLAAIHTALSASAAAWNLVLACDMPRAESAFLRELLDHAEAAGAACLVPRGPSGLPEPLCAVYHRSAAAGIGRALAGGVRKVTEALAQLPAAYYDVAQLSYFQNVNTIEEWLAHARE